MICSCSDETLCLIGNGRDSTSHGVCRLIDDRGGIEAVISLENKQLRSYALEPAGSIFFRCWTQFSDGV
jgi:hypothetical protein